MPKPHVVFVAVELALASFAIGCRPRVDEPAGLTGGSVPDAGTIAVLESGLPCDVAALLATYCVRCHAATPAAGVPMPLVTIADLIRPARSDPGVTVAGMALTRMRDATRPMPPAPAVGPSGAQIAAFSAWVAGGYGAPACASSSTGAGTGGGGGAGSTGGGGNTGGVGNTGGAGNTGGGGSSGGASAGSKGGGGNTGGGGGGGAGGAGAGGMAGTGGAIAGVPCEVQAVFAAHCTSCHGARPTGGAPMSLVTYADLTAPARSDPTRTVASMAVLRMQSAANPMPPAPAPLVASGEIATISSWIAAGYPATGCGTGAGTGADGGTGAPEGGVVTPDPFAVPPTCTSNTYWGGGEGAATMNPGLACISCHRGEREAPTFTIAGTLYPTAHEPDRCNGAGAAASAGARIVITGADGNSVTLTPNTAGNFYYQGAVATPFHARVTYMGRTREMGQSQTSGDCNSCHTQNGANQAPGRILLP